MIFRFDFLKILSDSDHWIKLQASEGCPGRSEEINQKETHRMLRWVFLWSG